MWFLIPGLNDTLRVNGRAEVWVDEELNQLCAVNGKAALSVLKIHIEEIFFHCPKALMRSGLWDLGSHQDRSVMPPMRQIIRDQLELERLDLTEEEMNRGFRETLY
jgi:predicted pyridoxine 5'-phosphate oxidase superfamily flavin-nucleotide-binding protein